MTRGVIVLGSINTDLVVRAERLPRPGETVAGGAFFRAAGGKGANQAVAAARVSTRHVTFVGAVGDDAFGRDALAALRQENLNCEYLRLVHGVASGVALIMVDAHGENAISVASGANAALSPDDVDAIPREQWQSAGTLLASLETPLDTVSRALRMARAHGLRTILNPAPAPESGVLDELLEFVNILTPNQSEAASLSGLTIQTREDAERAAQAIRQRGCESCIVTLGDDGCLVCDDDHAAHVPPHRVSVVDATAAGDCFSGVLAAGLAEGLPLHQAVARANAAAAIACTRPGAQPSLPRRDELERFLALGR